MKTLNFETDPHKKQTDNPDPSRKKRGQYPFIRDPEKKDIVMTTSEILDFSQGTDSNE